jgi:hypothetical protein
MLYYHGHGPSIHFARPLLEKRWHDAVQVGLAEAQHRGMVPTPKLLQVEVHVQLQALGLFIRGFTDRDPVASVAQPGLLPLALCVTIGVLLYFVVAGRPRFRLSAQASK